jgi:predicted metal-binding protein
MSDIAVKEYIVIVQCHIVKEHCAGYLCERALHQRTGGFADYPADKAYRMLMMTCGGCCGRALQRKLMNLITKAKQREGIEKEQIIVQFSSCITLDSHHGPVCPHFDYLKTLVERAGLEYREDTNISATAEQRRKDGIYQSRACTW